jgi:hypothetical protein
MFFYYSHSDGGIVSDSDNNNAVSFTLMIFSLSLTIPPQINILRAVNGGAPVEKDICCTFGVWIMMYEEL